MFGLEKSHYNVTVRFGYQTKREEFLIRGVIVLVVTIVGTIVLPGIGTAVGLVLGLMIAKTTGKPWWKDKRRGWPQHGVRDFFHESERFYNRRDIPKAIEVLHWGIKFSHESGSGGAVHEMQKMIRSLERER